MKNEKTLEVKHYRIILEPDLARFRFEGTTEIRLEAREPVKAIPFHILDLAVWECRLIEEGGDATCGFHVEPKDEVLTVVLPEERQGEIRLRMVYSGMINDLMAGFYRSRYRQDGVEQTIAVTQFEESDARRVFPCFDHPAEKAVFDVEMVVPGELTALSNGPVMEERILEDGRKRMVFLRTPRMSTYLLFFGMGAFEVVEDPGPVTVRVITVPGMTEHAHYGLKFGRQALAFCENYYGIPYPIPKLDLIAVPDFAFGAMENWGAITFRENLLLYDPTITSRGGEERICEVIAHEIAHQWFGNLVTPSDWRYLWLNESFATYFATGVVDHYHPDWGMWDRFLSNQTDIALERDAMHETVPIEIPGGEHVVINASTAPIIYNKGGSVLRQVEGTIGKDRFKAGIRRYLKAHEYGNASSEQFWEAFEDVSDQPITKMMKSWVGQAGYPIVTVKREGDRLRIRQKRFTYLPNRSEQVWVVPVSIQVFGPDGSNRIVNVLLEGLEATVDLGPGVEAFKINHDVAGFYRVHYLEKAALDDLALRVQDRSLSSRDRWGLQNDLYALVKAGTYAFQDYLGFLDCYSKESAFLPLSGITGNLLHAFLILGDGRRVSAALVGRTICERLLKEINFEPTEGEAHAQAMLRDKMLWYAVLFGSEEVLSFALEQFQALMKGSRIHPDIVKSVMRAGAYALGSESFQWITDRLVASENEHERMNLLAALGSFKEEGAVREARHFVLTRVPARNQFIPISYMSVNPFAAPSMWDWYIENLERIEKFHPIHYQRVIGSVVPIGGLGKEDAVRAFFKDYNHEKANAGEVIALSLEKLEIHTRMRKSGNGREAGDP